MKYDVFISYRRKDAAEYARQIQLKLENYGYAVFLDHDELKDGLFDQRIIDAIKGSKVFVALLTPLYMSRCADKEDWVRKEIECAVENNLHIVPINIDRQFRDFPSDCPTTLRTHIGQHQYSEIFTGQQFTTTMNDLNENRLKPYLGGVGSVAHHSTLGAVVRIKPDMDCRVMKFGEELALLQGGIYNVLRLMKGKHPLDFVSIECPTDHIEKTYVVEDNQSEDFFEIALAPIRAKRLKAIEDEKRRQREEVERRERERVEAERRVREERERRAKEEAERKEAERREAEHNSRVSTEKDRVRKLLDAGKGRDGIYAVGDYYDRDGVKGIVIQVGNNAEYDHFGMIVSLVEYDAQWAVDRNFGSLLRKDNPSNSLLKENKGNWRLYDEIGSNNAGAFMSFDRWQERFPAFSKAFSGNINGGFWHLPSASCLNKCIKPNRAVINSTLRWVANNTSIKVQTMGGLELWADHMSDLPLTYWSCNELDSSKAICVSMGWGVTSEAKTNTNKVRAVRAFKVERTAADKANEQRWRQLGIAPKDLTRTKSLEEVLFGFSL